MANTWLNADGLYIKYGTDEAIVQTAGEFDYEGPRRVIELVIPDLTKLTVTNGGTILDDFTEVPKGARIESVEIITETAVTGVGAVFNLGFAHTDRVTLTDYQALVAAATTASLATVGAKATIVGGSTFAGTLVGTTTTYPALLTADYDTAAFTAGKLRIRVFYFFPTTNS